VADVGILEILVTDAPAYDISAVDMTIANIEVHLGIEDEEQEDVDEDGWETVIEGSRSFELLALRGIEAFLGSKELEIGHYTGIRMDIEEVIVTVDGGTRSATVPGGKLKLISSFNIEAGKTTALTLDFDAEKSVVIAGNGKVNFKPTIKIIVVQYD
jgi:hypothetical protein